MTDLLTLVMSDLRYFVGTIILIGWIGIVVSFMAAMVIHFIRGK